MSDEIVKKKMRKRSLASVKEYDTHFSSRRGKKILWDLMKHAHFLESPGVIDPNEIIFREGQRDVVRYIFSKIKTDHSKLQKLIDGGLDDDRDFWS